MRDIRMSRYILSLTLFAKLIIFADIDVATYGACSQISVTYAAI